MSEDIVNNNPKKEFMYALGGIALFLGIVLIIGVSAFLRPAGEHITAETTEASAAADEAEAIAAEDTAATDTAEAASADTDTDETATVGAGESATETAADATVTPTEDTSGAVVSAEAGTATASGTVSQAAVEDTELTAEQADGDLDAGTAEDTTAAQ
ncbi:hypothetical protein [uncultured Psychrobacter sp.]|jgi:hypothetical protein|uniref:hypothetical protein n=1 Tax=uncultured Psychrobacter sp. TaxID=259303 RepID=UPI00261673EC|nr:hypothetical protein [uncultured Psychrobacter sp.]